MTAPFLGEIKVFGFNFAPRNWALCNGQLMGISQNTALFSILGTTYGGDGQTTFGLPDFRGRVPISMGQGQGLSLYDLGEMDGSATETLVAPEASHSHAAQAVGGYGQSSVPTGNLWAQPRVGRGAVPMYTTSVSNPSNIASSALGPMGGNQPHNNVPPVLALTFVIAVGGIFPTRN